MSDMLRGHEGHDHGDVVQPPAPPRPDVETPVPPQSATEARTYRARPVVVQAMRITPENMGHVVAWTGHRAHVITEPLAPGAEVRDTNPGPGFGSERRLTIHTSVGEGVARVGDWVVRGDDGEYTLVKASTFARNYEAVQ